MASASDSKAQIVSEMAYCLTTYMRVPFILLKSHIFVFMKEILRKYIFLGKKYIDLVTLRLIFIGNKIYLNAT